MEFQNVHSIGDHIRRLFASAKVFMIDVPYTVDDLVGMTLDLLRMDDFHQAAYIRPLAYKCSEQIGVSMEAEQNAGRA